MRASGLGSRIERLEVRRLLSVAVMADLNSTTVTSTPGVPVALGAFGYFSANDGIHGGELWRTDGTTAGTQLVKDINPGAGSGMVDGDNQEALSALTNVGGTLFFPGNDGINGFELWKSDGTAAGTLMVKDIASGSASSTPEFVTDLNGVAIFNTAGGYGVYRSDGTSAGTTQIAAVGSGEFAQLGNDLYFLGSTLNSSTIGLWQTDGTAAGTTLIRQFSSLTSLNIVALNSRLYFSAADSALNTGIEPWSSDGTSAGTVPLGDLVPGTTSSSPANFAAYNGNVFFTTQPPSGTFNFELYRTDSSANSAVAIANLGNLGGTVQQSAFVVYDNELYFTADDVAHGLELWRSNGTAAGTGLFDDLYPGKGQSQPRSLQVFDGRLFFVATTPDAGTEMFSTDGTVAGTMLLKDIAPGTAGIATSNATIPVGIFNGRLYFRANDILHGGELWSTDGTSGGTALLKDINTNTDNSNPSALTLGPGGFYYFTANDGFDGTQLWKTDGTANGTSMLSTNLSSISSLTYVNGLLLFIASDTAGGLELWSSDGTVAGTMRVKDISPGATSGLFNEPLVKVGQRVYFGATTDTGSTETYGLWMSDGSATGTQVVKPPSPVFNVYEFSGIAYNGKLICFSPTGAEGTGSIFISDGTNAGTSLVESGFSEGTTGLAGNWNVFNGRAYFTESSSAGTDLWSTDGTTAGTSIVQNTQGANISQLTASVIAGGYLYFVGSANGVTSLWRIDAMTSIATSVTTNQTPKLVAASASGGALFTTSNQIFRFDGTSIIPLTSPGAITPTALLGSANGLDYFAATTSTAGNELWMTDGTAAGTVMVQDLVPGSGSSSPQNFSMINGTVYVSATTPATGREIYELPPYARLNSDGSLTLEGTQSNDVLSLNSSGGTVSASLFGATLTFPQSAITHGIHIVGDGGTDTLNIIGGAFTFADDLGNTAPNLNVTISQGANVTFGSTEHLNSLTISGAAALDSGGGNVLVAKSLTVQPTGGLDLANNAVIVDYTSPDPLSGIQSQIMRGFAAGGWNGLGIGSSWAAARGYTLGFGESSKLLGPSGGVFAGQTVDGTAILIHFTLPGDANLDGQVNSADFAALAANYGKTGATFVQGDFNFDGTVNALDFNALATQYGGALPTTQRPIGSSVALAAPASLSVPSQNLFANQPIEAADPLLE